MHGLASQTCRQNLPVTAIASQTSLTCLSLQPLIEIILGQNLEIRFYIVVAQSAELSADDFEFTRLGGGEVDGNVEPRHEVLLHAKFAHEKGMAHILGMQHQQDGFVHRDGQRTDHDIVAGRHIVRGVQSKVISAAVVNLIRVDAAEYAVGTGVTEIEGELLGLDVNFQRVRIGWRDVDRTPSFRAHEGQRKNFESDQNNRECDQRSRTAGKDFNFPAARSVARSPHEYRQKDLAGKKKNAGPDHGFVELVVYCRASG